MKNKKYIYLAVPLLAFAIIGFFTYQLSERELTLSTIERRLSDELGIKPQKILYVRIEEPFTYVFYQNGPKIGISLIDAHETHILGEISSDSKIGFSYGTGESDELDQYILFGTISNQEIAQVLINDTLCNIIKTNGGYLWYTSQPEPFQSLKVEALTRTGEVVVNQMLYVK